jgi:hypothetical protein
MTVRLVTRLAPILLFALIAMLAGCGGEPAPFESPLSTPLPEASPVAPGTAPATGAPALPTPSSSDLATVGGILIVDQLEGVSLPRADAQLYLARVIRATTGEASLARFDEKTSPAATTDSNGAFVFTDVPPDTYGLAIWSPMGSALILTQEGEDLLFEVKAGDQMDLGEIHTDFPY